MHFLREQGYQCEEYIHVAIFEKKDWEQDISHQKERYQQALDDYSTDTEPHSVSLKVDGKRLTWEEYRQYLLTQVELKRQGLEFYEANKKQEQEFEHTWGQHLQQVQAYHEWLRKEGHYRPDFIAKNDQDVFIVEVKSQSDKGMAKLWDHQEHALKMAAQFDLTPMLLVVPLNIRIDVGQPQCVKLNPEHIGVKSSEGLNGNTSTGTHTPRVMSNSINCATPSRVLLSRDREHVTS
jgi:hypothetical protein